VQWGCVRGGCGDGIVGFVGEPRTLSTICLATCAPAPKENPSLTDCMKLGGWGIAGTIGILKVGLGEGRGRLGGGVCLGRETLTGEEERLEDRGIFC
jgi:hypothetical protein